MFVYVVLYLTVCFGDNLPVRISQRQSMATADTKQGHHVAASMHRAVARYYAANGPKLIGPATSNITSHNIENVLKNYIKEAKQDEKERDSDL